MNTAVQTTGGGIRFAKRHPFDYSLTTRFKAVHVLDYLRPQPGDSILDVGCGLGFFLNAMARRGVVGHGMCQELCNYYHANLRFHDGHKT